MQSKLPYINLGCGYTYHKDWTNVDFISTGEGVIGHNLSQGVPFGEGTFEVVYHSHVLEHFSKYDGKKFLQECFRVLKKDGIIRIAIPDLQKIIVAYQMILSKLKENPDDKYWQACYDWIMLEMYDQTVRDRPGGAMIDFLRRKDMINEDYILERCGYEVKAIIDASRNSVSNYASATEDAPQTGVSIKKVIRLPFRIASKIKRMAKRKPAELDDVSIEHLRIGKFRRSGEIHQWMYDEVSLARLLKEVGFKDVRVVSAFESRIKDWQRFELELVNGKIRKPDSLFVEAIK